MDSSFLLSSLLLALLLFPAAAAETTWWVYENQGPRSFLGIAQGGLVSAQTNGSGSYLLSSRTDTPTEAYAVTQWDNLTFVFTGADLVELDSTQTTQESGRGPLETVATVRYDPAIPLMGTSDWQADVHESILSFHRDSNGTYGMQSRNATVAMRLHPEADGALSWISGSATMQWHKGAGWFSSFQFAGTTLVFKGTNLGGDFDQDGIPDAQDADVDGDGIPNAQDPDNDGDGVSDADERRLGTSAADPRSHPNDLDGDAILDADDTDADGDGWVDACDPHPGQVDPAASTANPGGPTGAIDGDGDGVPDFRDADANADCRSDAAPPAKEKHVPGLGSGVAALTILAAQIKRRKLLLSPRVV